MDIASVLTLMISFGMLVAFIMSDQKKSPLICLDRQRGYSVTYNADPLFMGIELLYRRRENASTVLIYVPLIVLYPIFL